MTSISRSLQRAVRQALTSSSTVTAFVPPAAIVDRHGPPQRFPCIILGEGQEIDAGLATERNVRELALTVDVWSRDPGLTEAKTITTAVRSSIGADLALEGAHLVDLHFASSKFVREPNGASGRGVMTILATVEKSSE